MISPLGGGGDQSCIHTVPTMPLIHRIRKNGYGKALFFFLTRFHVFLSKFRMGGGMYWFLEGALDEPASVRIARGNSAISLLLFIGSRFLLGPALLPFIVCYRNGVDECHPLGNRNV